MWPFKRKKKLDSQKWQAMTLLPPDMISKQGGLPAHAVCGSIEVDENSQLLQESFKTNPQFVEFLHEFIRTEGCKHVDLLEAAKQKGDGELYVFDNRAPVGPRGFPPEEIIGVSVVSSGQVTTYHANDSYRVLTQHGLTKLPGTLHGQLLRALVEDPER